MSLLIIVLLLLVGYLIWRQYAVRKTLSEIVEAAEKGVPLLMENSGQQMRWLRLDQLVKAVNKLITQNADISSTGQSYLEQVQTTLMNLREAVVMVDLSNTIILANPAFSQLVDESERPLGRRLDSFIHGESFQMFLREFRKGQLGERREIEARVGKKELWLEVSVARLAEHPQSNEPFTLFFFHDVTRQKGLERMRTEFVANVSHELRTPVTVIKGFAETLIEDEAILSPEEKVRFLNKIVVNADRQHGILQDLLLLSRLESTEMVLRLEEISVSGFLKEVCEGWEASLEGKKLEKSFTAERDIVMADPLRLTQVLTNLFENILKHSRDFTTVRTGTTTEEGMVCLYVEDDGSGIPEKDLPHIFERFYRVDKGRSRESGGTGLGLSIVKHIVNQHGGTVHARSERGSGTRIEIRLPVIPEK